MKPFMKTFIIQGVIGSVIALGLLTVFNVTVMKKIPELEILTSMGVIVTIYLLTLLFGVILTSLSTFFSMRKYLDADIDELYE